MTVHHVGGRPPARFQDANYSPRAVMQPQERTLSCSYLHGSVAMGRPREIVPLCALHSALSPRTPAISTFSPCLCGWVRDS